MSLVGICPVCDGSGLATVLDPPLICPWCCGAGEVGGVDDDWLDLSEDET